MASAQRVHPVALPTSVAGRILSWRVGPGDRVRKGFPLCTYTHAPRGLGEGGGAEGGGAVKGEEKLQLKASVMGVVKEVLVQPDETILPG